ncbi:plasmid replication protein RepC [Agrobacterium sp. rho-13.3]|uniref:plasmid replication protein RepC n=1 Tax=Agrobacterium sp. rho-13.3 TaxID=3072980 RepID=UPI002A0F0797|nr:plasmid replication protein RepC [Agrobacterium sp. rho-13.3]MDX8308375.1 plasmid replication protein RepC [Agrobacterium sp. rho-13.3]
MNSDIVTTPFGRRGVSVGLLASQFASRSIDPARSIDKWKLFRAICEARPLLGISDRSLAVLNALLSFYPKAELSEENGLVVFPSNQQLSLRAHGMAEQTLRRHLAALVDAGLILRKDSPNGKRYARKDRKGSISDAYGFFLAPLMTRADEIRDLADQVIEDRLQLQRLREKISLCRRDIIKFNEVATADNIEGDWETCMHRYLVITSALDRKSKAPHLLLILEELGHLREEMANQLEKHVEMQKISANAYQNERLIQSSESESIFERRDVDNEKNPTTTRPVETDIGFEELKDADDRSIVVKAERPEGCDLQTLLKACPDIALYGPNGNVRSWNDLKQATSVVRTMLSISQSAYEEAEKTMGMHNTNAIIACILERASEINSAGGYLRSLTEKARAKQFSIKPMLMALLRTKISTDPAIRAALY